MKIGLKKKKGEKMKKEKDYFVIQEFFKKSYVLDISLIDDLWWLGVWMCVYEMIWYPKKKKKEKKSGGVNQMFEWMNEWMMGKTCQLNK